MMNGYDEKHSFNDEPEPGSFVKAFDAFRKIPSPLSSMRRRTPEQQLT